jgi:hypothetical protein
MTRLGPECRGKLPPGAQEMMDRALESWRASGLPLHVEVLPCEDCVPSLALKGKSYALSNVPPLPALGCNRSPCCGCCYTAIVDGVV